MKLKETMIIIARLIKLGTVKCKIENKCEVTSSNFSICLVFSELFKEYEETREIRKNLK